MNFRLYIKLLLPLCCLLAIGSAQGQDSTRNATATTEKTVKVKPFSQWAVGLVGSSNGPGLQVATNLGAKKKAFLTAYYTYLPLDLPEVETSLGETDFLGSASGRLGGAGLNLELHPFGNAFKFVFGAAYLQTELSISARTGDSLSPGDIKVSPEEFGSLESTVAINRIAPYFAIGFTRAVPRKRRIGFGFEIGTFYVGKPDFSFTASGMLAPSSENEEVLRENVDTYQFLPSLKFNLNIKLTK
jgi:hypothetical protein